MTNHLLQSKALRTAMKKMKLWKQFVVTTVGTIGRNNKRENFLALSINGNSILSPHKLILCIQHTTHLSYASMQFQTLSDNDVIFVSSLPCFANMNKSMDFIQWAATTIIFCPLGEFWRTILQAVDFLRPFTRMPIFNRGIDWSLKDIPSLQGKIVIVTGSNSGIGFETARTLAVAQATVIMAVRNERKGFEAKKKMLRSLKIQPQLHVMKLDLSSLASIKEFSTRFTKQFGALDILVNNAGVMNPPGRRTTEDGFELQFGTNHLGHFALTARLLPVLRKRLSRVVNVSSLASHQGTLNFDDLMFNKRPFGWQAYAQSKLANLLFTQELNRISTKEGWGILSVAAHPGLCSSTEIVNNGAGEISLLNFVYIFLGRIFLPSAETSMIPVIYAATSECVRGGEYFGPKNLFEVRDGLSAAAFPPEADKKFIAERLWNVSTFLTEIEWAESEN